MRARAISRRQACAGLAGALVLPCAGALAQNAAALAGYQGADREQRLVEGAKREGELLLYSSMQIDSITPLKRAFEAKYGVKVNIWRGSGKDILQRAITEAAAGRHDVDVMESDSFALEALNRESLLQDVRSPYADDLVPQARAHAGWVGTRVNIVAGVYNTRLVKKERLPKTYEDLLDGAYKGMLGIEADDYDWFGMLMGLIGGEKGLKLFREIVAANGISVRKGHTLLANLVVSGEVPLALTTYVYKVEQLKKDGAPIDWLAIPPAVARFEGAGVARRAAHPNAAILFFEFMLSDAQELLRARDFFLARRNTRVLPGGVSFLDPAKALDENQKWSRYFREIMTNQAR
jgi:iron(III) transport system substrate-binding protein